MVKVISVLMMGAMLVQLVKPLGLPGLKRRGDFWKIALFALGALMLTIGLRELADALA